jgi:tRNA A37 methylthiotransferase MiaB
VDVLRECEHNVDNGAIKITLLGQNVNSYKDGADVPKCFAALLLGEGTQAKPKKVVQDLKMVG